MPPKHKVRGSNPPGRAIFVIAPLYNISLSKDHPNHTVCNVLGRRLIRPTLFHAANSGAFVVEGSPSLDQEQL